MTVPTNISIEDIRKYMLDNGCRVTNHSLVKHFKSFLTNPESQDEARKQFKTYVNILATIRNENNQKYLVLRKKYINECPTVESSQPAKFAASEDEWTSTFRKPLPADDASGSCFAKQVEQMASSQCVENIKDPIKEPILALEQKTDLELATQPNQNHGKLDLFAREVSEHSKTDETTPDNIVESTDNSEIIPVSKFFTDIPITSAGAESCKETTSAEFSKSETIPASKLLPGIPITSAVTESGKETTNADFSNPISVKEATRKFNRMASEDDGKVVSPSAKKMSEKPVVEEKITADMLLAHSKAKEWIVSMARACYQEVAKLANEFPELVKLQDPSTGYTALHWAAKHGNEDVIKLIAGSYKADVNSRTNGGYTPLHLAMQFGHENIFELLCNVYNADRDLTDYSGNKPLDYLKQCTRASLSKYEYFHSSDAAFSSENITNNSAPFSNFRHSTTGASISAPLTHTHKRSHPRATILGAPNSSLTRTQSMMTSKCAINSKRISSISHPTGRDGLLSCGLISSDYKSGRYPQNSAEETKPTSDDRHLNPLFTNRKESFLRKTLRAASASNRSNPAATNLNVVMD